MTEKRTVRRFLMGCIILLTVACTVGSLYNMIGKVKYSGKLAVIVDDCGADLEMVKTLLDLDVPFTYAILPYQDYSVAILQAVKSAGNTVLLHLPMEPYNSSLISQGMENTIFTDMTAEQISNIITKAADSLLGVDGVNNHQGSKAVNSPSTMITVLIYFL